MRFEQLTEEGTWRFIGTAINGQVVGDGLDFDEEPDDLVFKIVLQGDEGDDEFKAKFKPWLYSVEFDNFLPLRNLPTYRNYAVKVIVEGKMYILRYGDEGDDFPERILKLTFRGLNVGRNFYKYLSVPADRMPEPYQSLGLVVRPDKVFGTLLISDNVRRFYWAGGQMSIPSTVVNEGIKGIAHRLNAAQFKKLIGKRTAKITEMPTKLVMDPSFREFNAFNNDAKIIHAFYYEPENVILFSDDEGNVLKNYPYIAEKSKSFTSVVASAQNFASLGDEMDIELFYDGEINQIFVVFNENGSGFEVFNRNLKAFKLERI